MLSLGTMEKAQTGVPLSLGNLTKTNPRWKNGLRWTPSPGIKHVDCDLWQVLLKNGQAIEFVRYDETDPNKVVFSPSGALQYGEEGHADDRDGSLSDKLKRKDDEIGIIDFGIIERLGGDKVLLIANIYEPKGMTFDQVAEAHLRTYPEGDESTGFEIDLTSMGQGANTIIFGWHEQIRDDRGNLVWTFMKQPSHAPSIQEALAPFGVG